MNPKLPILIMPNKFVTVVDMAHLAKEKQSENEFREGDKVICLFSKSTDLESMMLSDKEIYTVGSFESKTALEEEYVFIKEKNAAYHKSRFKRITNVDRVHERMLRPVKEKRK